MLRGKQTGTLYGKDRAVKQAHYSHRSKRFPRTGCPDYGKRTPLCNGKAYIADKILLRPQADAQMLNIKTSHVRLPD